MENPRHHYLAALVISVYSALPVYAEDTAGNEYLGMDIAELMQVTITSVSKKPQALSGAPAAVYVISADDIKRSGVTSIPEALRMVPGLQVARISSNKWAVSSRGLNGMFANKLLVLMDGRTLYSPAFSGTYWDMQHTLLEDVERIEVIRGPGATMWGANAVNGVINIITKSADTTQGGYLEAGTGNEELAIGGLRYGTKLSENTSGRIYATYNKRDAFALYGEGADAHDEWEGVTAGFRLDGEPGGTESWTLHGDIYQQDEDQIVDPFFTAEPPYYTRNYSTVSGKGWNVLGKWQRKLSEDSSLQIQAYYDYVDREESYLNQTHRTADMELQYDTWLGESHNLTMGIGYRNVNTSFTPSFMVGISPDEYDLNLYSGFIQDVVTLVDDHLWLTLGTKWEHNDFTGDNFQPTARLMYQPNGGNSLWASVSRAVRTPSLFEQNGFLKAFADTSQPTEPVLLALIGSTDFGNEEVIAYEAGYRWFPSQGVSIDVSLFYNDYDDLLGGAYGDDGANPQAQVFVNSINGYSYGLELAADWQVTEQLRLVFTYAYIDLDMEDTLMAVEPVQATIYSKSSPNHQASLQASVDILDNLEVNGWVRYVGELEATSYVALMNQIVVDDYLQLDLNVHWKPTDDLEVVLAGENLLGSSQLEFVSEFFVAPVEVERSVYLKLAYHF